MDQLNHYRNLIKNGLEKRRARWSQARNDGVETVCAFDDEHGSYLLLFIGWRDDRRVEKTMLNVRLHDGKIWIETDDTEDGFATELLKAGVPNTDIVLAFHPPHLRQYTDFAVA